MLTPHHILSKNPNQLFLDPLPRHPSFRVAQSCGTASKSSVRRTLAASVRRVKLTSFWLLI